MEYFILHVKSNEMKKKKISFVSPKYIFYSHYYIPLFFMLHFIQVVTGEKKKKSIKRKCSKSRTVLSEIVWYMILLSKLHRGKYVKGV